MDGTWPGDLKPRKAPRQARSEATLDAIFEATVQVLLADGAQRLTTTRVAMRAGVSVGTLYQHFPHKQALLYAVLGRHLDGVAQAVEAACARCRGQSVAVAAESLVGAYVDAKAADMDASRALYLVSAEFDVSGLVEDVWRRILDAAAAMLAQAADAVFEDLAAVAFAWTAAMAGAVRVVFERAELMMMGCAYLLAASTRSKALDGELPSQPQPGLGSVG